jgi:uncharacterized tellurite resistance protein B-like protein
LDQAKGAQGAAESEVPEVADRGRQQHQETETLGSFGALLKESLDKRR